MSPFEVMLAREMRGKYIVQQAVNIEGVVAGTLLRLENTVVPDGGHLMLILGMVGIDIRGFEDAGLINNLPYSPDEIFKIKKLPGLKIKGT